mmetsp:Transcript_10819/g.15256  ORF Transcript_10819/g.15256 Transcript_10819/m.15256 type:complete len:380 (+) Transcript_10819:2561-3700(+)
MTQAILRENGTVVPRRTLCPLTTEELHSPIEERKRQAFDNDIKIKLGDSLHHVQPDIRISSKDVPSLEDFQCEDDEAALDLEDPSSEDGQATYAQAPTDNFIAMQLLLPQGENMKWATVKKRSRDSYGNLIGTYNDKPQLNTAVYDIEFPDGIIREYAASTIAENIYSQIDESGFHTSRIEAIVDYDRLPHAIPKEQSLITIKSGQQRHRKTTVGWNFLVRWVDGREQWVPLRILKESNPVEVVEFAVARNLQDEAAFVWWVQYVLRKRNAIMSSINSRIKHTTHKYGVEVPRTMNEAMEIDRKNQNRYWQNAIDKEMANVAVAFDILPSDKKAQPGWSKSSGHLVFDVKMDFTRKARWVKNGHHTPDPVQSTFAGVVS